MNVYLYKIDVLRVVDGDTVDAIIHLGFDVQIKERIRLAGIDAPETRTRCMIEKEKGNQAKDYLIELLETAKSQNQAIYLQSTKFNTGKFGRVLGDILIEDLNVNQHMITEGYATEY